MWHWENYVEPSFFPFFGKRGHHTNPAKAACIFFPFLRVFYSSKGAPVIAEICIRNSGSVVSRLTNTSPQGGRRRLWEAAALLLVEAVCGRQERNYRKTAGAGAPGNGIRVDISPWGNSVWTWGYCGIISCGPLGGKAFSIIYWHRFNIVYVFMCCLHEWNCSLKMETRTERAPVVHWGSQKPANVRPAVGVENSLKSFPRALHREDR